MVLGLYLTAELSGVTDLRPTDTADSPYYYTFKVQCTSCRETHANWVGVSRHETNEQSGSRGEANFVWRCKNCKRESSASIKEPPQSYIIEDAGKSRPVILMDCRGCEFTDFKPDGHWEAVGSESGTKFTEVDLSEGSWYDYDEKAGGEVSVEEVKWDVKRA